MKDSLLEKDSPDETGHLKEITWRKVVAVSWQAHDHDERRERDKVRAATVPNRLGSRVVAQGIALQPLHHLARELFAPASILVRTDQLYETRRNTKLTAMWNWSCDRQWTFFWLFKWTPPEMFETFKWFYFWTQQEVMSKLLTLY